MTDRGTGFLDLTTKSDKFWQKKADSREEIIPMPSPRRRAKRSALNSCGNDKGTMLGVGSTPAHPTPPPEVLAPEHTHNLKNRKVQKANGA